MKGSVSRCLRGLTWRSLSPLYFSLSHSLVFYLSFRSMSIDIDALLVVVRGAAISRGLSVTECRAPLIGLPTPWRRRNRLGVCVCSCVLLCALVWHTQLQVHRYASGFCSSVRAVGVKYLNVQKYLHSTLSSCTPFFLV